MGAAIVKRQKRLKEPKKRVEAVAKSTQAPLLSFIGLASWPNMTQTKTQSEKQTRKTSLLTCISTKRDRRRPTPKALS